MHLDRVVDNPTDALGHHGLHHVYPDSSFAVAEYIHCFRSFQYHQAHRFDVDPRSADDLEVSPQLDNRLAERDTAHSTADHQVECFFGGPDRAHAVMDAARPQPKLADFEAASFAKQ